MKRIYLSLILFCISISLQAQNLYPVMVKNCVPKRFCLDCGDVKANVDESKMNLLVGKLIEKNNLSGIEGTVLFQILVDSTGKGCVLSHTDTSKSKITRNIISALNSFDGFIPPKTKDKTEKLTSINMSFKITGEKITAKIKRVDMVALNKSFDRPVGPDIQNKGYAYKNENLKNYKITVWKSNNSNLPNNMNDEITVDKDGLVWLTVDKGLVTFDGNKFKNAEQNITEKGNYFRYNSIATDNNNVKWVYASKNIYNCKDGNWTKFDSLNIGFNMANRIINNTATSEVFFCTNVGLFIYKNGKWSKINTEFIKELPSNHVAFAKRDSKNRIWIGTYSGTVLIDKNGKATGFNDTKTVLKGKCITSMDEDEKGNLYFSLYEYDRKEKNKASNNEGIAIRDVDGKIKQFTPSNSGMPVNQVAQVIYDKNEKVLWIATERGGLVRYDLNKCWENYHNDNSQIPTSFLTAMAFDNNGVLYIASRQGLIKIERK